MVNFYRAITEGEGKKIVLEVIELMKDRRISLSEALKHFNINFYQWSKHTTYEQRKEIRNYSAKMRQQKNIPQRDEVKKQNILKIQELILDPDKEHTISTAVKELGLNCAYYKQYKDLALSEEQIKKLATLSKKRSNIKSSNNYRQQKEKDNESVNIIDSLAKGIIRQVIETGTLTYNRIESLKDARIVRQILEYCDTPKLFYI